MAPHLDQFYSLCILMTYQKHTDIHMQMYTDDAVIFTAVKNTQEADVFLKGEELELGKEFKYLGAILDSSLTFKKHIKNILNTIKFNLLNSKQIRPSLTVNGPRMFLRPECFCMP